MTTEGVRMAVGRWVTGDGEGAALGVTDGVRVNEGVAVGTGEGVRVEEGLAVSVGEAVRVGIDGSADGVSVGANVGTTMTVGEADGVGVGEEIGSAGASTVPQATRTQHPAPITHNLARVTSVPPP